MNCDGFVNSGEKNSGNMKLNPEALKINEINKFCIPFAAHFLARTTRAARNHNGTKVETVKPSAAAAAATEITISSVNFGIS